MTSIVKDTLPSTLLQDHCCASFGSELVIHHVAEHLQSKSISYHLNKELKTIAISEVKVVQYKL